MAHYYTYLATLPGNLIVDLKACNLRSRPDGAPTHSKVRVTDETQHKLESGRSAFDEAPRETADLVAKRPERIEVEL